MAVSSCRHYFCAAIERTIFEEIKSNQKKYFLKNLLNFSMPLWVSVTGICVYTNNLVEPKGLLFSWDYSAPSI